MSNCGRDPSTGYPLTMARTAAGPSRPPANPRNMPSEPLEAIGTGFPEMLRGRTLAPEDGAWIQRQPRIWDWPEVR